MAIELMAGALARTDGIEQAGATDRPDPSFSKGHRNVVRLGSVGVVRHIRVVAKVFSGYEQVFQGAAQANPQPAVVGVHRREAARPVGINPDVVGGYLEFPRLRIVARGSVTRRTNSCRLFPFFAMSRRTSLAAAS